MVSGNTHILQEWVIDLVSNVVVHNCEFLQAFPRGWSAKDFDVSIIAKTVDSLLED